ncbi:MAG: hypothetical protein JWR03_1617 [Cohnella sp.]|nr:hypothetical protein [Cohnella sp.]
MIVFSAIIEIQQEIDQFTEYTVAAQIVQMSLFPDITQDDVRKTLWLLRMYPERNYELAKLHMKGGMSEYDLASAHGGAKRIASQETTSDITANTVVLKDNREILYLFYKKIAAIVGGVLNNIRDPHQKMIAKLLWEDGMLSKRAVAKMKQIKQTEDIWPIAETTFFEKRRKVIEQITKSLSINGTLDFVVIDYGLGRNSDGECRFLIREN